MVHAPGYGHQVASNAFELFHPKMDRCWLDAACSPGAGAGPALPSQRGADSAAAARPRSLRSPRSVSELLIGLVRALASAQLDGNAMCDTVCSCTLSRPDRLNALRRLAGLPPVLCWTMHDSDSVQRHRPAPPARAGTDGDKAAAAAAGAGGASHGCANRAGHQGPVWHMGDEELPREADPRSVASCPEEPLEACTAAVLSPPTPLSSPSDSPTTLPRSTAALVAAAAVQGALRAHHLARAAMRYSSVDEDEDLCLQAHVEDPASDLSTDAAIAALLDAEQAVLLFAEAGGLSPQASGSQELPAAADSALVERARSEGFVGHRTRSVLCCAFDSLRLGAGTVSGSAAGAAGGGAPAWSVAAPSLFQVAEGGGGGGGRLASATRALARVHGVPAMREFESHGGRRWAASHGWSTSSGGGGGGGGDAGQSGGHEAKGSDDAPPGPGAGGAGSAGASADGDVVRDPGRYAQRARLAEPWMERSDEAIRSFAREGGALGASLPGIADSCATAGGGGQGAADPAASISVSGAVPAVQPATAESGGGAASLDVACVILPALRLLRSLLCCYSVLGTGALLHTETAAPLAAAAAAQCQRQAEILLRSALASGLDPLPPGDEKAPSAMGSVEPEPASDDDDGAGGSGGAAGPEAGDGPLSVGTHAVDLSAVLGAEEEEEEKEEEEDGTAASIRTDGLRAVFRPSPERGNLGRWFDPRAPLQKTPGSHPRKTVLPSSFEAILGLRMHARRLAQVAALPAVLLAPPSAVVSKAALGSASALGAGASGGAVVSAVSGDGERPASAASRLINPLRRGGFASAVGAVRSSAGQLASGGSEGSSSSSSSSSSAAAAGAGAGAAAAAGGDDDDDDDSAAESDGPSHAPPSEASWPALLPAPATVDFAVRPRNADAEQLAAIDSTPVPPLPDDKAMEGAGDLEQQGASLGAGSRIAPNFLRWHANHRGLGSHARAPGLALLAEAATRGASGSSSGGEDGAGNKQPSPCVPAGGMGVHLLGFVDFGLCARGSEALQQRDIRRALASLQAARQAASVIEGDAAASSSTVEARRAAPAAVRAAAVRVIEAQLVARGADGYARCRVFQLMGRPGMVKIPGSTHRDGRFMNLPWLGKRAVAEALAREHGVPQELLATQEGQQYAAVLSESAPAWLAYEACSRHVRRQRRADIRAQQMGVVSAEGEYVDDLIAKGAANPVVGFLPSGSPVDARALLPLAPSQAAAAGRSEGASGGAAATEGVDKVDDPLAAARRAPHRRLPDSAPWPSVVDRLQLRHAIMGQDEAEVAAKEAAAEAAAAASAAKQSSSKGKSGRRGRKGRRGGGGGGGTSSSAPAGEGGVDEAALQKHVAERLEALAPVYVRRMGSWSWEHVSSMIAAYFQGALEGQLCLPREAVWMTWPLHRVLHRHADVVTTTVKALAAAAKDDWTDRRSELSLRKVAADAGPKASSGAELAAGSSAAHSSGLLHLPGAKELEHAIELATKADWRIPHHRARAYLHQGQSRLLGWLEAMRLPAWHGGAAKAKQPMWNSIRAFARRMEPLLESRLEGIPQSYREFAMEMRFTKESAIPESVGPPDAPRDGTADEAAARAALATWTDPLRKAVDMAKQALEMMPAPAECGEAGRDAARAWAGQRVAGGSGAALASLLRAAADTHAGYIRTVRAEAREVLRAASALLADAQALPAVLKEGLAGLGLMNAEGSSAAAPQGGLLMVTPRARSCRWAFGLWVHAEGGESRAVKVSVAGGRSGAPGAGAVGSADPSVPASGSGSSAAHEHTAGSGSGTGGKKKRGRRGKRR